MWALKQGDPVELIMAGRSSYIPATVLRSRSHTSKTLAFVEYSVPGFPSDYVDPAGLRPRPPPENPLRQFNSGEEVDAFRTYSWHRGSVSEILQNSSYSVKLNNGDGDGEDIVCDRSHLRLHRDWNPLLNSWDPPPHHNQAEASPRTSKNLRLKIVFGKKDEKKNKTAFRGLESNSSVEVTSSEEGYKESWYAAKLIGSVGTDKFLVEYKDLLADDDDSTGHHLRETAQKRHVRPEPPRAPPRAAQFKRLERVEARYNDGWWEGVVSQVRPEGSYVVYFAPTNEELVFPHSDLRPRIDDWLPTFEGSDFKPEFEKGMAVEVRSDEVGYEGSRYTATVVKLLGYDKFVVEYQTLKSEDETRALREVAKGSDLRPVPPRSQRVYPFEPCENVDCWYNDGWWVGVVSRVLSGKKYMVYFSTNHEELEFAHYDMRPHQEFVDGKWVFSHPL